jgi:hypothetical protein
MARRKLDPPEKFESREFKGLFVCIRASEGVIGDTKSASAERKLAEQPL